MSEISENEPVNTVDWIRCKYPVIDTLMDESQASIQALEREVESARQALGVVLECEDLQELLLVVGTVHRRLKEAGNG